jgi:hypothetical protein
VLFCNRALVNPLEQPDGNNSQAAFALLSRYFLLTNDLGV